MKNRCNWRAGHIRLWHDLKTVRIRTLTPRLFSAHRGRSSHPTAGQELLVTPSQKILVFFDSAASVGRFLAVELGKRALGSLFASLIQVPTRPDPASLWGRVCSRWYVWFSLYLYSSEHAFDIGDAKGGFQFSFHVIDMRKCHACITYITVESVFCIAIDRDEMGREKKCISSLEKAACQFQKVKGIGAMAWWKVKWGYPWDQCRMRGVGGLGWIWPFLDTC